MKKIILIRVCFFSLILLSCEREIDVEIPDNNPKIVLSTHIGAGDSLTVFISTSIPINFYYNNLQYNFIDKAIVEISKDEINWNIVNYKFPDKYTLPLSAFNPVEGQTYFIRAAVDGYKSVKSSCTIPYYNPTMVSLVKVDTINTMDFERKINFTVKIIDALGIRNFYGIKAFYGNNELFLNKDNSEKWLFNDINKDGSEFVFKFEQYIYPLYSPNTIRVRLYQTDEAFYLFNNSYKNIDFENPFSEPVLVYSNIENGLGICDAYTYRDYYFTLP
jgi:hypothetical protein